MNHTRRTPRRHIKRNEGWGQTVIKERDLSKYPCPLTFYVNPPDEEIGLEEFEELAIARLHVLKACETGRVRFPSRNNDFTSFVSKSERRHLPIKNSDDANVVFEHRRRDYISHFILRLAYCRTEDLRRWFITQETELFRHRIMNEDSSTIHQLFRMNNMHYDVVRIVKAVSSDIIDKDLKNQLLPSLIAAQATSGFNLSPDQIMHSDVFEVPFEQALDLVRSRQALVRNGFVYVMKDNLIPIIIAAFRMRLSASLAHSSKALPSLEEDDRLLPMLKIMSCSQQDISHGFKTNSAITGHVTPADIPTVTKESFPLCMRTAQEALKSTHHLRHGARMQYGLFLKGIGMTLDDALAFWRTEFTKGMSQEKFEKSYAYNIRHNYGKEGKRQNYTPYSCMKIIMGSAPSSGDAHGCPFKHYNEQNLKTKLLSYKVPTDGIHEIVQLVKGSHFQLACARYFELTHEQPTGSISITHPNQYFEESRKIRTAGKASGLDTTSSGKEAQTTTSTNKYVKDSKDALSDQDHLAAIDGSIMDVKPDN
eukprot:gene10010-2184_t